jgi:hypothetical protein
MQNKLEKLVRPPPQPQPQPQRKQQQQQQLRKEAASAKPQGVHALVYQPVQESVQHAGGRLTQLPNRFNSKE